MIDQFFIVSWFFGAMKRDEAVRSLMRHENDSEAFLIRNHDDKRPNIHPGWFTLSWRRNDFVIHREIAATDNGKYMAEGREYDTLYHFIEFYPWRFSFFVQRAEQRLRIPALKVNTCFFNLEFHTIVICFVLCIITDWISCQNKVR